MLVEVGANRCPYLVEIDGILCDATHSGRIGFYDRDGRICAGESVYMVTDPFFRSGSNDVCRVRDVRAVTDDELLERYASMGRIPPLPPVGSGELRVTERPDATPPEGSDTAPPEGSPEEPESL